VLAAIRSAHSVHQTKTIASVTSDVRADESGTVAGTFTIDGIGSLQLFSRGGTFEA